MSNDINKMPPVNSKSPEFITNKINNKNNKNDVVKKKSKIIIKPNINMTVLFLLL